MKQSSAKKGSKEQEQEEEAAEKKRLQKKERQLFTFVKDLRRAVARRAKNITKKCRMNEMQWESVIVWRVLNTLLLGESNGDRKEK